MNNKEFTRNTIEAAIRLGLLLVLAFYCFNIVKPFILPVLWGVIIAVAIYPLFMKFKSALGERNKLASIVYTIVALALIILPTIMLSNSLIDTSNEITQRYESGTLNIPPPIESVRSWPMIGEKIYVIWSELASNLQGTLYKYQDQLAEAGKSLISAFAGFGGSILQFILSVIISGVLLANATGAHELTIKLFSRLTNVDQGPVYTDLSKATIRSVAQGVLGVAVIQASLSAAGMLVMDVPAWGLWSMLIMVLAIAQLPPLIVLGFVVAYVFSVADTAPAVLFAIYCVIVSASDSFLKPIFLGRGMDTPMLVILLGAIGGMLLSGIVGLFVGAIILALGYELFLKWLNDVEEADKAAS